MMRALALAVVLLAGCAGPLTRVSPPAKDPEQLADEGDAMIRAGRYREARHAYHAAASQATNAGVRDRVLFALGQLALRTDNPERDHGQAFQAFDQLANEYPRSRWAAEARAWRGLLGEFLAQRSELITLRQQIDRLRQQSRETRANLRRLQEDLERLRQLELELDRLQRR